MRSGSSMALQENQTSSRSNMLQAGAKKYKSDVLRCIAMPAHDYHRVRCLPIQSTKISVQTMQGYTMIHCTIHDKRRQNKTILKYTKFSDYSSYMYLRLQCNPILYTRPAKTKQCEIQVSACTEMHSTDMQHKALHHSTV